MLCVSDIHRAVNQSDIVKGFARRSKFVYDVEKIPGDYVLLFVKHRLESNEIFRRYKNNTLCLVSREGHLKAVKYLISIGANPRTQNNYCVRQASKNGYLDVVKFLVFVGAEIGWQNNEAVRRASERGHLGVVRYLVSLGANVQAEEWHEDNVVY